MNSHIFHFILCDDEKKSTKLYLIRPIKRKMKKREKIARLGDDNNNFQ